MTERSNNWERWAAGDQSWRADEARRKQTMHRTAVVTTVLLGLLPHAVLLALMLAEAARFSCDGEPWDCKIDHSIIGIFGLFELYIVPIALAIATPLAIIRKTRQVGIRLLLTTVTGFALVTVVAASM